MLYMRRGGKDALYEEGEGRMLYMRKGRGGCSI
jgi:hypothetical protein